jgi:dipeptidase D
LGADNGLGAAAILAVLASSDMAHPAIEALFTVDEEAGMTGAKNLQSGWLKGTLLLNLDTEEDDEFTIGCAGGIDTFSRFSYPEQPVGSHEVAVQLHLRGLVGGHSGMDIHRGFGNANKLLVRAMLETGVPFRLASMDGGSLRNAIPREAQALVVLAGEHKADFVQRFQASAEVIRREYATTDPKMQCAVTDAALPARAAAVDISMSMARAISACPNGADRWSPDMDNLVETSSNLARVIVGNGHFETQSLQRSAINAARDNMAHRVADVFRLLGAEVEHKGAYPGWAPNPHSALVDHMVRIYTAMHGEAPRVMACHAGLECGIIGEQYPHLDMISFGPTIRGAHSPDERASIASAQKFWHFLTRVLAEIPAA